MPDIASKHDVAGDIDSSGKCLALSVSDCLTPTKRLQLFDANIVQMKNNEHKPLPVIYAMKIISQPISLSLDVLADLVV